MAAIKDKVKTAAEWTPGYGGAIKALTEGEKKPEPPKLKPIDPRLQDIRDKQLKAPKVSDTKKSTLAEDSARLKKYREAHGIEESSAAETRNFNLHGYKKGTRRVPKTGKAKLHKGEAVLNKKQAKKYRAAAGSLGAGQSKRKR